MAKEIKYLNGYEIVDEKSRNDISEMKNKIENGEGASQSQAIIDVTVLPTEDINEGVFYRLMRAKFVSNFYWKAPNWICHCVNELPNVGEPVTKSMEDITAYYSVQQNEVYGYVDSFVSAAGGVPVGWYPIGVLGQAFDIKWGGVITDESDMTNDAAHVLLSKDYYMYQNGWCKLAMGYEKQPEFDIQWDGVIGDKFSLDLTPLGFPNVWFVKISDEVFTSEQLIGATYTQSYGYESIIEENDIDSDTYPGALNIDDIIVCYSSDDTNAALGLPSEYLTNGIYFVYYNDGTQEYWTDRLVAPSKVVKIDEKFLPEMDIDLDSLHTVSRTGNYNDLNNKPNLSNYATTSQLSSYAKKSEVETMISNAIGSAIGGSY